MDDANNIKLSPSDPNSGFLFREKKEYKPSIRYGSNKLSYTGKRKYTREEEKKKKEKSEFFHHGPDIPLPRQLNEITASDQVHQSQPHPLENHIASLSPLA